MTGAGFFFVHRALWLSGSASLSREGEARRLEAWIWLLAQANWGESGDLKPGQLTTTRGKISAYTGWTDGKVRSWLKSLCKEGAISLKRNGNHSILTVENWAKYQSGYRLDLGPSQDQARTELGPSQDREGSSSGEGLRADGTKLGPSQDQARTELGPATREELRTKNQTSGDKSPAGEGVLVDERGNEWKPAPKKGRVSYSVPFGEIWKLWLDAKRRAPDSVKTPDKPRAYMLVRGHIQDGTATAGEIYTATKNYLEPFASGRERYCKHPTTFYRVRAPLFLEHIEATAPDGKPLITLAAFRNDPTYALNCARVAQRRLDQTATDFDDGAGWDEFEALPQEVKLIAVRVASE